MKNKSLSEKFKNWPIKTKLIGSFVKILKEFNFTLNQIKETSAQVDHGSDEVAAAANDLATDSARAVVNTKALIGKTVEEIDKGNEVTGKTAGIGGY